MHNLLNNIGKAITLCFLILLISINISFAKSNINSPKQSQLHTISEKIKTMMSQIIKAKSNRNTIATDLEKTEVTIGALSKTIDTNKEYLNSKSKTISNLKNQEISYIMQLQQEKLTLKEQTQSAYLIGKQPFIQLLLNNDNIAMTDRYLQYYAYFNKARINHIKQISSITSNITETRTNLEQEKHYYTSIQIQQINQQSKLLKEQNRRKYFLSQTTKDIKEKSSKLAQLLEDKNRLQETLNRISKKEIILSTKTVKNNFAEKGPKSLCLVNNGKIIQSYGQSLLGGAIRSDGLLISANNGEQIRSVMQGKVIFASWLRGYGLLVIIQHKNHYLSLYGHNQSLYVKNGDDVQAHEVIATVGQSGGFATSSLYFEIRHDTTPINPMKWFNLC